MKKLFSVLAVLFVLGTSSVFARVGIGAQFGTDVAGGFKTGNAALTFKIDTVPCIFALDLGFGDEWFAAGLSADWWIANPKIEGTWGYYYAIGVGLAVGGYQDNVNFGIGPRAVLGTNIFLLQRALEFYLQLAWQPTFYVGSGGFNPKWGCFPVGLGFRFWFDF